MTSTILDELKLGKKLAVFFTKMRPLKHLNPTVDDQVYCYSTNLPDITCSYTNQTSTFVTTTVDTKGDGTNVATQNRNLGVFNPLF